MKYFLVQVLELGVPVSGFRIRRRFYEVVLASSGNLYHQQKEQKEQIEQQELILDRWQEKKKNKEH